MRKHPSKTVQLAFTGLLIVGSIFQSCTANASDFGRCLNANPSSNTAKCFDACNGQTLFQLGLVPWTETDWNAHRTNIDVYNRCVDVCYRIGRYEMKPCMERL